MSGIDAGIARAFPALAEGAASEVRVLVMTGYGLNCEAETRHGFACLGAQVDCVHVADLLERPAQLDDYAILAFIGGFSFGDHVASGRVFANRLRFRLGERLAGFVDRGGLAIGMCNGFQTMVKLGLLPGESRAAGELAAQSVSLMDNDRLGYRNAWVRLGVDPDSPCVWTRGIEAFDCPSRHGEGKLVFANDEQRAQLDAAHQVPVRYVDGEGKPTTNWPDNPNGSVGGAAGLCDASGRLFGLMPHPEAFLYPENHPRWRARADAGEAPDVGDGLRVLANGVLAALE